MSQQITRRRDVRGLLASVLGVAGLVVLALGWQHAAAGADEWRTRYEQTRAELDAAAEHVPAPPAAEWAALIRAACDRYPDVLAGDPLCDDWTQVAPEDLDRPTS